MSADALSQEEIDALLKGAGGGAQEPEGGNPLEAGQAAAVGDYADRMAATQSEMIGTFLATEATVSRGEPERLKSKDLVGRVGDNAVLSQFTYSGGLKGPSALVLREIDAAKIGGVMVGDPGASEFSDMVADAFKEVINTILGNLSTALATKAGRTVSTGQLEVGKCESTAEAFSGAVAGEDPVVVVPYNLSVGSDLKSEFWQILSESLVGSLEALSAAPSSSSKPAPAAGPPRIQAAPVEFESLTDEHRTPAPSNLNLIMDIGLGVRVELGRTHMKIRDILNLGSGSVVELDKLAGEPVDLLVNDVIFAKGEVVVIDENFGVRITDILSLNDRIKTLGERRG